MKKIAITILAFYLSTQSLSALPTGNPSQPSLLTLSIFGSGDYQTCSLCAKTKSFRIGYYGDYVYNRRMGVREEDPDSDLRRTEIYTNSGYVGFNMFNRVEAYAAIGTSYFNFIAPNSAWNGSSNANSYLKTETGPSYLCGLQGTIWECNRFSIGADGKYFYAHPQLHTYRQEGDVVEYLNQHLHYQEWQAAVGGAYFIPISPSIALSAYAAVKGGKAYGDFRDAQAYEGEITFFNIQSTQYIGYSVGCTLIGCAKWDITAEIRFIDEYAFHFNTQFSF